MDGKENIPVTNIRNSIELLQKERSRVESYLHELIEIRKSLEEKVDKLDVEISELNDEETNIEASNAVLEYKASKLEKEANQLEDKNKCLRETIESLQSRLKGYKEKRLLDLERFGKNAVILCERFGSASTIYSEDTIQAETDKVYQTIAGIQNDYEETATALNICRDELDDIVLYQTPYNTKESEIPLIQRKGVLNMFEDAHMRAETRLEKLNHIKAVKEAELNELLG